MNLKITIFFALLFIISAGLSAQDLSDQVRLNHFVNDDGLALEGYDPVSYFKSEEPEKGNKKITHTHKGLIYRFLSEENKKAFIENPDKYEPAYGGWCAYALAANGNKMEPDPETYKILDGKVYLFYNSFFNNTLPKWNEDEANMKTKADEVWQKMLKE